MSACSSAVKIYMHLDEDSFVNEEINAKTNNLIETSTLKELISEMTDYTPLAGQQSIGRLTLDVNKSVRGACYEDFLQEDGITVRIMDYDAHNMFTYLIPMTLEVFDPIHGASPVSQDFTAELLCDYCIGAQIQSIAEDNQEVITINHDGIFSFESKFLMD